jgi:hypothetical protein
MTENTPKELYDITRLAGWLRGTPGANEGVHRLENFFAGIGKKPIGKKCKGNRGRRRND